VRYSLPLIFLVSLCSGMDIIGGGSSTGDGVGIASVTVNASLIGNGANPANALGLAPVVTASSLTVTGNAFSIGSSTLAVVGGSVGIGTASPGTKLHLSTGVLTIDGNATNSLIASGRVGLGVTNPSYTLDINGQARVASTNPLRWADGNAGVQATAATNPGLWWFVKDGSVKFTMDKEGNFGIGTQQPLGTLDVNGSAIIESTAAVLGNFFSVGGSSFVVAGSTVSLGVGVPLYVSSYVYANNYIQLPSSNTMSAGANFNIEWSTGAIGDFVLIANSSITVSHAMPGQTIAFRICQSAIGGFTAVWGSSIFWGSTGPPTITTTANYCDWISMTATVNGKVNAFLGYQAFPR
jgi:hypothetical protein